MDALGFSWEMRANANRRVREKKSLETSPTLSATSQTPQQKQAEEVASSRIVSSISAAAPVDGGSVLRGSSGVKSGAEVELVQELLNTSNRRINSNPNTDSNTISNNNSMPRRRGSGLKSLRGHDKMGLKNTKGFHEEPPQLSGEEWERLNPDIKMVNGLIIKILK